MFSIHDEKQIRALLPPGSWGTILYRHIERAIYKDPTSVMALPTLLPSDIFQKLADIFVLNSLRIERRIDSYDGETTRLLLITADKFPVESVILRHRGGRCTLCVSSQSGCAVGCLFCATGRLERSRDLSFGEILDQLDHARRILVSEGRSLRNVVFMGMGEPLLNCDEVFTAVRLMVQNTKYNLASRRITISTCGVIPGILRMSQELPNVSLAVSLHAPEDALRSQLMPGTRLWPLSDLFTALDSWYAAGGRQVMHEYLMIQEVTDRPEFGEVLIRLLQNRPDKINFIAYNNHNGPKDWFPTPFAEIDNFRKPLSLAGIITTIRYGMGGDIRAACGQLAGELKPSAD